MILVLTPNPALDITYEIAAPVRAHGEHRVARVHEAAGGKGVNVARVLAALGERSILAGPLGGTSGQRLRTLLGADGASMREAWTQIEAETRRTVTAVDAEGATAFNEPGPQLSPEDLERVLEDVQVLAAQARIVVISGSLPPTWPPARLGALVARLRETGAQVVVDTSGPALLEAARAGASLLKPNLAEAQEATGREDPLDACRALLGLGAGAVLGSCGADGMLAVTADRAWSARPPRIQGNPTGAGDAAVAAAARALLRGSDLPQLLREAVATSASAVSRPIAGQIDPDLAQRLLRTLTVTEMP